jgi:hypothetical protein
MNAHPLSIKRAAVNMVVNAARYGDGWIKVSSGRELQRGVVPSRRRRPGHCTGRAQASVAAVCAW